LIIGGGISGALTAYYLTQAGIECIVVDARTVGLGSTSASTCLLQYELDTPLHQLMDKIGEEKAIRCYQACGDAVDKLSVLAKEVHHTEYETVNSLYFSTRRLQRSFIGKEFAARKKAGFEVELLGKDDIRHQYGLKAEWAILSKKGGATDAYLLTHQIFQWAQQKGLRVFNRTKAATIDYGKKQVLVTTADGFTIQARYIVNATGFEVGSFIKKGIVNFDCTYAIISEQQEEKEALWKDRVMMWNTEDPYLYMRLTKDNRIIVGGRDEPFSNAVTREMYLQKKASHLKKDFEKLQPAISFKTEFAWSGTFGKTKDSLPYIGMYAPAPRTFYALGFGGNGITFSLVAAEIIRDQLQGKPHKDAALFSFDR
jgi:glycine/D-amino acid oxidase-like deaminating enzyme